MSDAAADGVPSGGVPGERRHEMKVQLGSHGVFNLRLARRELQQMVRRAVGHTLTSWASIRKVMMMMDLRAAIIARSSDIPCQCQNAEIQASRTRM